MTDNAQPLDVWAAVDQERHALIDDLAGLDDNQWDAQSLCAEWKAVSYTHLTLPTNREV